jgi:hypothetical protein
MFNMEKWLKSWDLQILDGMACHQDLQCDCGGDEPCKHLGSVYWISTFEDLTVGVFGWGLSPRFKSKEELAAWVAVPENRKRVEKDLEQDW